MGPGAGGPVQPREVRAPFQRRQRATESFRGGEVTHCNGLPTEHEAVRFNQGRRMPTETWKFLFSCCFLDPQKAHQ